MITPHFTPEELTTTAQVDEAGHRLGNEPDLLSWLYLRVLALEILEPVRALWECPVTVLSGYRGELVERSVQEAAGLITKGAPLARSQHAIGQAADIVPANPHLSVYEAFRRLVVSTIPYDQALLEGPPGHEWIHISCAPNLVPARRQALVSATGRAPWTTYIPPEAGDASMEKPA